jgi:DNA-3-methyladenine glycosylase
MVDLIDQGFFERPVLEVARSLIGCTLCVDLASLTILETEAYGGLEDPGSHAYSGRTKRNAPMFGPAGHAYVYLIYGLHHCFNIVTGAVGYPEAVLIRAGRSVQGKKIDGPGRLTRFLGITRAHNGISCTFGGPIRLYGESKVISHIHQTTRIGLSKGRDFPWRFVASSLNSQAVV